jgi:DNA-binding cell septation regulator SpoVG
MKINIEHHDKSFNVGLASREGAEPFIVIKGCRIVDGSKGRFVSWPAKKMDSGKYWNHVYATEAFQAAVLDAYDASAPKPQTDRQRAAKFRQEEPDDIPF